MNNEALENTNETASETPKEFDFVIGDSGLPKDDVPNNDFMLGADTMSGNLPFAENHVGDRFYESANVSIKSNIIELLKAWNLTRPFSSVFYDQHAVSVMLKEIFGKELARGLSNLDRVRLNFVKDLFSIRVKQDEERMNDFDMYMKKKCDKFQDKYGF